LFNFNSRTSVTNNKKQILWSQTSLHTLLSCTTLLSHSQHPIPLTIPIKMVSPLIQKCEALLVRSLGNYSHNHNSKKWVHDSVAFIRKAFSNNDEFKRHCLGLASNLKKNRSALLFKIEPKDVPFLSPDDLAKGTPGFEERKRKREHILGPQTFLEDDEEDEEDQTVKNCAKGEMMRCRRCKGSDISFSQLQTRSADEGMTAYYTCDHCGKRWKQS
jgi:DNA-directed RNA polymerase subunit M/transcription elongation factor TFIIS